LRKIVGQGRILRSKPRKSQTRAKKTVRSQKAEGSTAAVIVLGQNPVASEKVAWDE